MEYRDRDFANEEIILDDNVFTGCTFTNIRLIFQGVGTLHMTGNHFIGMPQLILEGPARNTISFLRALYQGFGDLGRQAVDEVFEEIRRAP